MLNESCGKFRIAFEPRADAGEAVEAHRRRCPACAAWAARLEDAVAGERSAPLPKALRERLLAIPAAAPQGLRCRDVERLYEAARREARHGEIDPEARAHLAACRRCQRLYGTLGSAFSAVRRPMPETLRRRLLRIATPRRPPVWIRDGRFAVAASALLTASLMLFAGDPVSLLRATVERLESGSHTLSERGAAEGQAAWARLTRTLSTTWEQSKEKLAGTGEVYSELFDDEVYRELWNDAVELYEDNNLRRYVERARQGEDDVRD
jgi:hypothetical protein